MDRKLHLCVENCTSVNLSSQIGGIKICSYCVPGNQVCEKEGDDANTKTKLWFSFKCLLQSFPAVVESDHGTLTLWLLL